MAGSDVTEATRAVRTRGITEADVAGSADQRRLRFRDVLADDRVLQVMLVAAIVVRLAFWLYTQRVWEDALITITPARNAWLGNGLTHHVSEPRVHSFTSPISVLIPLVGEPVRQGLLMLRLTALAGAVVALLYAARIASVLQLGNAARIFLYGFLAFEQLHVFFGMAGMETQVAVAILLANLYYLLREDWLKLGIASGLAMLARPEFVFWLAVVGVLMLVRRPRALLRWTPAVAVVTLPWLLFTTLYYGSPVPHTIEAKSLYSSGFPSWDAVLQYLGQWWGTIAPFRVWFFTLQAPVPAMLLKLVAFAVLVLALVGLWRNMRQRPAVAAVGAFLLLFFLYRTLAQLSTYFMWYLPPITAMLAVLVGLGINRLAEGSRRMAMVTAGLLVFAFGMHIPFTFPLEKRMQRDVEEGVRTAVGEYLDDQMGADDAVVLEPLGFIGFAAFNKTTWDYPGLSSEEVTDTLAELPLGERNLAGMIEHMRPTYTVLRDGELEHFRSAYPDTAAQYEEARKFRARPDLDLSQWGLHYFESDTSFTVLRRTSG